MCGVGASRGFPLAAVLHLRPHVGRKIEWVKFQHVSLHKIHAFVVVVFFRFTLLESCDLR